MKVAENKRRTKGFKELIGLRGKVVSFTQVLNAPTTYQFNEPYYVGIVELENGKRIDAQLCDKEPSDGCSVLGVLRKLYVEGDEGLIEYGIKFKVI